MEIDPLPNGSGSTAAMATSITVAFFTFARHQAQVGRGESIGERCRAHLDHLESVDADNLSEWSNVRLKRILVDYNVLYALKLAESRNILELVDIDVFQEAKKAIDCLRNQEVGPALAWCADNKSGLRKSKSKFEFQLRLQEFVELV